MFLTLLTSILGVLFCAAGYPAVTLCPASALGRDPRAEVTALVGEIRRADYEADRDALDRLHRALVPFVEDRQLGARVLYWRGFARWRRALNGFNDAADPAELGADLELCATDFRRALGRDPVFVDAKIGLGSCLINHAVLLMQRDAGRSRDLYFEGLGIVGEALAAVPENARVLWVHGANQWYSTPERGGGQAAALATYEKGLALARQQKGQTIDPLEPAWGEPELLMNLAFANLNRAAPDVDAAERFAEAALALVPRWHYVRNILLPQIRKAKGK